MSAFQIVATTKDGVDPDRRIDAVQLNTGTILSLDQALAWINAGHSFWTTGPYNVPVHVHAVPATMFRRAYLTTSPDGTRTNNLLHLPDIQPLGGVLRNALR